MSFTGSPAQPTVTTLASVWSPLIHASVDSTPDSYLVTGTIVRTEQFLTANYGPLSGEQIIALVREAVVNWMTRVWCNKDITDDDRARVFVGIVSAAIGTQMYTQEEMLLLIKAMGEAFPYGRTD